MEWIAALGRTLGFSLGAGINLYATVAIVGLAARYQWVDLPAQFRLGRKRALVPQTAEEYQLDFLVVKIRVEVEQMGLDPQGRNGLM